MKCYDAFVTHSHNYVLLDGEGDIRASAYDLQGIMLAKNRYGWGDIHEISFVGKVLKIGKKIR